MTHLIALATACVLGFLHALEVDHMLAVTAFVSRRPTIGTAARFGFRWGVGHSIAVLAVGGVLLASGLRWSVRYDRIAEAAVGVMLIAIGLWSLRSTRNLHVHLPSEHGDHAHLHTHRAGTSTHRHQHHNVPGNPHPREHHHLAPGTWHLAPGTRHLAPGTRHPAPDTRHLAPGTRYLTLVGMVHGLAGTSAVVALVPMTLIDRVTVGVGYLLAFGIGVTVAMTVFAAAMAVAIRQASGRSLIWSRRVSIAIGGTGILIGGWWVWSAVARAT